MTISSRNSDAVTHSDAGSSSSSISRTRARTATKPFAASPSVTASLPGEDGPNRVQAPGAALAKVDASAPASGAALKAGPFPKPAPEILERLEAAGAMLRRDGAVLRAGPPAALTQALRDEIRANKGELLAEIDRRTAFVADPLAVFDGATLARRFPL